MISTNHGLNLGQLCIQENAVSASVNSMLHGDVSLQSSHKRGSAHVRNMTDLESAKKSLALLFFRKIPVHSDASSSSASGTCERQSTVNLQQ